MSIIKKVTVFGGSGSAGAPIVAALIASGFQVTVIARPESTAEFPTNVTVRRFDLSSNEDLVKALIGQDAVVSALTHAATGVQRAVIDASIAAHVQRFIPSEFGMNTRNLGVSKFAVMLKEKVDIVDYLIELAEKYEWFSWTGLATGSFFEWSLQKAFLGFNLREKTAFIVDSGNERYSATTMTQIGQAVAGVLSKPEETANQYLELASFNPCQNELLQMLEESLGKFTVTHVKGVDLVKNEDEKIDMSNLGAYVGHLQKYLLADGAGKALSDKDNSAGFLGLEKLDIKDVVKKVAVEYK